MPLNKTNAATSVQSRAIISERGLSVFPGSVSNTGSDSVQVLTNANELGELFVYFMFLLSNNLLYNKNQNTVSGTEGTANKQIILTEKNT